MDRTKIVCPKCGQENDAISIDCLKCGIVFSKYYGILAKEETDEVKRSELLKRKEEEEAKAEALIKQREEEEARVEALRKRKEEARAEALRRQQEEEEARAEALRRQQEEEKARAEALRRQQEEEEAKAEALRRQQEEEKRELQKRMDDILDVLKPKTKIKDLLKKYEGQTIGINYNNSSEIKGANLAKVGDDVFSILIIDNELMKSFPFRNIISLTEGVNGVGIDNIEGEQPFPMIIEVYHTVS